MAARLLVIQQHELQRSRVEVALDQEVRSEQGECSQEGDLLVDQPAVDGAGFVKLAPVSRTSLESSG